MSVENVLALAGEAGVAVERLVVAPEPGVVPPSPAHRWVVVPMENGETTIGGTDRGRFTVYGQYETDELAANALAHLADAPEFQPPPGDLSELGRGAQRLAGALKARAAAGLAPSDIPVGTLLDHIGLENGHTLFLLDTPFGERSLPPTDLRMPRTGYVLKHPLPPMAVVGPVVAWFGQPGGGIMVSLDRPIRYYYDLGLLDRVRLVAPDAVEAPS
jgi:hypothetical protein